MTANSRVFSSRQRPGINQGSVLKMEKRADMYVHAVQRAIRDRNYLLEAPLDLQMLE
jgi:hypothetical protein